MAPKAENKLDLVSQREPFTTKGTATLTAELSSGKATGTVRQSKGEGVDFTAARATGPAGIYSVTALPSGKLTGGSTSGARVEGKLDGSTPANRLDATITTPNGKKYQLRGELGPGLGYNQPDRAVKLRWLVAQDGTIRGAVSRSKPGISVTVDTFD